ncbi:MAG: hypothetical protein AAB919_03090 [Patescibacteria group bacterium]
MVLSWSGRRKTLYTAVVGVLALIAVVFLYQAFFTIAPTCFDGAQNGDEHGVDCGGSCALVCRAEAHAPVQLWARIFQTGAGTYTAAAYIQNDNPGAGAKRVGYSFQLFDADNHLIVERDGVVDLPPVQTIPIIDPNIPVQNRVPTRVLFGFSGVPTWYRIQANKIPALRVTNQNLSSDASKLNAVLNNNSYFDARAVTLGAVLFDASGTARAASRSIVDVAKKSSTPIVFTFPGGVPNVVRAEITVLPSF